MNMTRNEFIRNVILSSSLSSFIENNPLAGNTTNTSEPVEITMIEKKLCCPLAITMWDFSWLERRWPGAGYENWAQILDELVERGYNAVRIDAYPHLVADNPTKEWTLLPVWDQQVWGSPAVNKIVVQPALNQFIAKCKDRKIKVGLSTWFREDTDNTRLKITSPEIMAENWIKTLDVIAKDGLMDTILYADLCNEWPGDIWAPFFQNEPDKIWGAWHTDKSMMWMRQAITAVRKAYPEMPLCVSIDTDKPDYYSQKDLSFMDLLERHIWMTQCNDGEFYKLVGYHYERFSPDGYKNLVEKGEKTYRARPDYWKRLLVEKIKTIAQAVGKTGLPLITTECWGIVDYKDWPLLNWDWVKELCELGALTAADTGQWAAIATSNFCGPQFVGMWKDVQWHQRLTDKIRKSKINESLFICPQAQTLIKRLN